MPETPVISMPEQYKIHSVTIGEYNTWNDWRLIPTSPPLVVPPKPLITSIDIPGRDGALDITEALDYRIHYGNRKGTWEFLINHERLTDDSWIAQKLGINPYSQSVQYVLTKIYYDILEKIYGQKTSVYINDDIFAVGQTSQVPFYMGRVYLSDILSNPSHSKFVFEYNLLPYRYNSYEAGNETVGRVGL